MIVTLELRAASRCPQCAWLTPLPGLRTSVSCRQCAAPSDFAARARNGREGGLRYPFGGYYDALAEAAILLDDGQDCRDARDSQGTPVTLRREAPRCGACATALPLPADGASSIVCPGCGDDVAVRWPDDETRAWDPRLRCVIGDGKARGADVDARTAQGAQGAQGAVVGCGRCGAPIAHAGGTPDRRRARACGHCGATNYLSDAAWLALFPLPDDHRCYLVYEVDARRLLALHDFIASGNKYWLRDEAKARFEASHARARAAARAGVVAAVTAGTATEDELRGLAVDPALTADEAAAVDAHLHDRARAELLARAPATLVVRWGGCGVEAVRVAVAGHAALPSAVLEALASDAAPAVRAVIARRGDAPEAIVARLRKDPDEAVVKAARANPTHRPGMLSRLFG